jgi:hypothetical protein
VEFASFLGFLGLVALPILLVWALIYATRVDDPAGNLARSQHPGLVRFMFRTAALAVVGVPVAIILGRPRRAGCEDAVLHIPCDGYFVEAAWVPWTILALVVLALLLLVAIGRLRRRPTNP